MRVLNIKETGKTRGGLISGGGGAYYRMYFLFTGGWAYSRGGGGGLVSRRAYKRQFTVFVLSFKHCAFKQVALKHSKWTKGKLYF